MTHVHWVSPATHDRIIEQLLAPLDPRTALQVDGWWNRLVNLREVTKIRSSGMIALDMLGFDELLGMLARKRPMFESARRRAQAFGRPIEEVNALGRAVYGPGWPGIGALTMCEPEPDRGALTCAGESGGLQLT